MIDLHPASDTLKTFDTGWRDNSLSSRTYIEKKVSAFAGDIRQIPKDLAHTFPVFIVFFKTSSVVHGHANLEAFIWISTWWDVLFWCFRIAFETVPKSVVVDDIPILAPPGGSNP
jgi:hypothetical protein